MKCVQHNSHWKELTGHMVSFCHTTQDQPYPELPYPGLIRAVRLTRFLLYIFRKRRTTQCQIMDYGPGVKKKRHTQCAHC